MGRVFLSLLLTVNLLACPLRCASCTDSEPVAVESSQPACCCCAPKHDAPAPPANPDHEDCECQDCICEGATLQDAPKLPVSTNVVAFMSALPAAKGVDAHCPGSDDSHDRSFFLSGRGMRIAHQSLLI
jgi:hypothetical protein